MTPLWRTAIKEALSEDLQTLMKTGRHLGSAQALASARCFDLREVQQLCFDTSLEIGRAIQEGDGNEFVVDMGERFCVPAPVSWLEFNHSAVFICHGDPIPSAAPKPFADGGYVVVARARYVDADGGEHWATAWGYMFVEPAGVRFQSFEAPEKDWMDSRGYRRMVLIALAGLAVIGSPAAVRADIEPHKGFAKRLSQAGLPVRGITHTRVTVGAQRAPEGEAGSGHGSPKAYHFCRAHARVKRGKVERVRAHWRGDPAFGYRLPSYTVKPQDSGQVAALLPR